MQNRYDKSKDIKQSYINNKEQTFMIVVVKINGSAAFPWKIQTKNINW